MIKSFVKNLLSYKKHVYSQSIEDGIIEGIFDNIGTTNKYFVEFGCWDGLHLSNTANLRLYKDWAGLLMEGNLERAQSNPIVKHEYITVKNVNNLFEKYRMPKQYDFLSIDIDGNDFWIWDAIDENRFDARVVCIEYNCNFPDQLRSCAIKYSPEMDTREPSIYYYSASIPALKKLGESKGYSLIFRVNLHNLFFVRSDLLHPDDRNIPVEMFLNKDCKAIYDHTTPPQPHWNEYADTRINIFWHQDFKREWVEIKKENEI